MDIERLIQVMEAGGASQAEIDATVQAQTQAKYEPKKVAMAPAFYLESDKVVTIGKTPQTIRLLNVNDLRRLLPKLIEVVRSLLLEGDSQQAAEEFLSQSHPMGVIGLLMQKVLEMNLQGDYPEWLVSVFEEVALLASNDSRTITAAEIISLPPSQLTELLSKLFEVNRQDFLALWASVPPGIRSTISILASRLTNAGKRFATGLSALENSFGGADSTGKPSFSIPSAPTAAGATASLVA